MMTIVKDRDLIMDVFDYDVILVGTSIQNNLGNGFQRKVGLNFPEVYEASKTCGGYGDARRLGTTNIVEGAPTFVLCYITKGRFRPDLTPDTLDYGALEKCLKEVAQKFQNKKIATTIIGSSSYDGAGNKEIILNLIDTIFIHQDIHVYDYLQKDWHIEKKESWDKVVLSIGTDSYNDNKKKFFWENTFGIFKPVPQSLSLKEIKTLTAEQTKKRKNI